MITKLADFLLEKKKTSGKKMNEDFGSQPEGEIPAEIQPNSGVEDMPAQPANELASKFEALATASTEFFADENAGNIDIKMFADFDMVEDDFKNNTYDFLVILNGKDLCVNTFNEESVEIVKVTKADVQDDAQPAQGDVQAQVQDAQPAQENATSEDIFASTATNELFGFGKKTYNLTDVKASKEAQDFFNQRKDLVKKYNEFFVGKQGMTEDQAKNAIMALYDFGSGMPLLKKYTLDFNKDTNTFTVDPNGKGLFNGSPIMG